MRALILVAFALASGPVSAQTFECRMGQNAACLDWGETVCTSQGMCVSKDAACFDSYQCDYKGFACKSDVDQCVEAHDKIVRDYNALLQDYETLRKAGKDLADAHNALQEQVGDLEGQVRDLEGEVSDLKTARDDAASCLFLAQSLETAKRCIE